WNGNVEFYAGHNQPQRMIIVGDSGQVGIGTSAPAHTLHVNGDVAANAFPLLSDGRYKTNVEPIVRALEKIGQMHGVSFDWRAGDLPDMRFEKGRQLGFVAQDLKAALPEAVSEDADGRYSVAYSKVVPVLVEGIKEQQAMLGDIQQQNQRLHRELEET